MASNAPFEHRDIPAMARALGQRIQAARARKRLTQAGLAEQLGVTDNAVTQWETGRATPRAERLEAIARTLGVMVSWLVTGEEPAGPAAAETASETEVLTLLRAIPADKRAAALEAVAALLMTFCIT